MSTPASTAPATKAADIQAWFKEKATPYLAPYYLTVAGVLGAATVGFIVVIVLLILVVANFNVLGLIE